MQDARVSPHFMERAVALGEAARQTCGANPWVGCVVVASGADGATEVVGEGAYVADGGDHAEVRALEAAGRSARGSTVYVTLEPCAHHGRTPPCARALVDAGVARVAVGVADPDDRVAGRGIALLESAGVDVEVGVERDAVERSLRAYLHQRSSGRPWCVLKAAITVDGRTAAADGSSKWITGEEARADVHGLRSLSQAVVVGSGTAIADTPRLTARGEPAPPAQPLRVVLDGRGRTPASGPLFDGELAPTLVVTTGAADADAVAAWKAAGAEVEEVAPGRGGGVDPGAVLDLLGRRGVIQALVEGGAGVHGGFLAAGAADELVVYVGPTALGEGGRPAFEGLAVPSIGSAPSFRLEDAEAFGDTVRLRYLIGREGRA